MKQKQEKTIVVVGGGAAGFFAAINAKINNPKSSCLIIEGSKRVLTKVKISGGGRCNVTHHCFDPKLLVEAYPRGRKELLGAFYTFQPRDVVSWFEDRGVFLKAERDGRMFPKTNKSSTIVDCLLDEAKKSGVQLELGKKISAIKKTESGFVLSFLSGVKLEADQLILATGSSPSGYEFCRSLGHKTIDPVPSLFTFKIEHEILSDLMGQSFESVDLELSFDKSSGLKKYRQKGPLLITHWGLSGPAVLKLSAFAARDLNKTGYQAQLKVNFIYPLKLSNAVDFLVEYKNNHSGDLVSKSFPFSFSKRFWLKLLTVLDFKLDLTWQELSKNNIRQLTQVLTESVFSIKGKGVFKEEFVTAGGVSLSEVNFRTMESRVCPSLYFAGEILDIDGITGGFNFQNAWTTAWIASQSV